MGNVFGRTRTTWERTFTTSFAAGSLLGFELPDHWMVAELQLQLPSFLVMSFFFLIWRERTMSCNILQTWSLHLHSGKLT